MNGAMCRDTSADHLSLADMLCRRKALLALSCLTRHCDPAMDAFREQGGLQLLLKTAADASDPRQQRCPSRLLFHMLLATHADRFPCTATQGVHEFI